MLDANAERSRTNLVLAVRNAGHGPALNAYAYAISTTRVGDKPTDITNVGNVPAGDDARVVIEKVTDADTSGERDTILKIRVILSYADLAGERYHTVLRLSDPAKGRRPAPTDSPRSENLEFEGTTVGEGDVPPEQWRVTFRGRQLTGEQIRRLRADALQYLSGHGTEGGGWSSTVFVYADSRDEAIERVRAALGGDQAPYGGWAAAPWGYELHFHKPTRRARAAEAFKPIWRRPR
jgi:hypothetical protein